MRHRITKNTYFLISIFPFTILYHHAEWVRKSNDKFYATLISILNWNHSGIKLLCNIAYIMKFKLQPPQSIIYVAQEFHSFSFRLAHRKCNIIEMHVQRSSHSAKQFLTCIYCTTCTIKSLKRYKLVKCFDMKVVWTAYCRRKIIINWLGYEVDSKYSGALFSSCVPLLFPFISVAAFVIFWGSVISL